MPPTPGTGRARAANLSASRSRAPQRVRGPSALRRAPRAHGTLHCTATSSCKPELAHPMPGVHAAAWHVRDPDVCAGMIQRTCSAR